jgi:AraC family transcriptional regulator
VKPDTRSFYHQAVQRAIEQIAATLDEALELDVLARAACLSPFHFHRVFRGMVGETPLELSRRLRLERAAWMLGRSDRPVTEIAFAAGYDTHEAFSRAFRGCYSTSPSGYRARRYRRVEIAATCGVHYSAGAATPSFTACDSGGQMMNVEIREMPEMRVGGIRHIGPYNQINQAFGRLGAIAGPAGLFQRPGAAMIAIFHDIPETTPPEQLRSDAGIVVTGGTPLPEGLTEQRVPAGRYARTRHVGPYEQLGDVWARLLGEWLPASGHRLGETPSYEIYRNDSTTVKPEELETDLYAPLV